MSSRLGCFSRTATPLQVRTCLLAYYGMLDAVKRVRADYEASSAALADRLAVAALQGEIEDAIASARAWLKRVAAGGGQGLPPPGGQELQATPGASMAHGCAAVASSGRTRAQELSGPSIAVPADPLFSAPPGQDLPAAGDLNDAQTQTGGHSCA